MSFWTVPESCCRRDALTFCDRHVQRQQNDRRRVDGHRGRDAIERDVVEQRRDVFDRIDGDADLADFAGGQRMVRVVSHLRRQIEGDAQPADAVGKEVAVSLVRFLRGREAGVLPHRPQPAAVHGGLDAASERELAGSAEIGGRIPAGEVIGRADRVHGPIVARLVRSPAGASPRRVRLLVLRQRQHRVRGRGIAHELADVRCRIALLVH